MLCLMRRVLFLVLMVIPLLRAQERDGTTVVQTPGVALVKPQPWSKPADAEIVKFTAFTDRSARGSAGAGYFVLQLTDGRQAQVPTARIVKLILKPKLPANLLDDAQRKELQKKIDDIQAAITLAPAATSALSDYLKPLQAYAVRYDAGEVMVASGTWKTRDQYRQNETSKIVSRLRRSLSEAPVKKDFDLESNADFIKLSEIAVTDADLKTRLEEMQAERLRLVSREEQSDIIAKLQSPLSPGAAGLLLERLKSIPDPGPRTSSVLRQADVASAITNEIDVLKRKFEALWTDATPPVIPVVSPEILSSIDDLKSKITVFHAGLPPAGLWLPKSQFDACMAFNSALPLLQDRLAQRNFKAMQEMLDAQTPVAQQIGPKSSAAITALKSYADAQLLKFSNLVDEGKNLLSANDKKKAVEKFREALAVMPDQDLEKRISEIK